MKGKKRISLLAVLVCVFALVFSLGIMSACGNSDSAEADNQWYYGAEVPADDLGSTGDHYLNTKTLASYVKTENGEWTETAVNWYYGTEGPAANLGAAGDFYLNTKTGALYQKGTDGWGTSILTLQGEKGRDGVVWFSGETAPNDYPEGDTTLKDAYAGDFYLNTSDFSVWQLNADETEWNPLGSIMGKEGNAGTKWFHGIGAPEDNASAQTAHVGDYYLRHYAPVDEYEGYQICVLEETGWSVIVDNSPCKVKGHQFGSDGLCVNCGLKNVFAGNSYHEETEENYVIKSVPADTTDLVIPGMVNGKPVKIEKAYFASSNKNLRSVTFEAGIESIPSSAFTYCSNLETVTFGEGLISIGGSAFSGTAVKSIVLPDSLTTLGNSAFYSCSSLTDVTIGKNVESLPKYAFEGDRNLKTVTFRGENVASIEQNAFKDCSALTSIEIPSSVKSLGSNAFKGCSSLANITFGESLETISMGAFEGCTSLTEIRLPDSLQTIYGSAFTYCDALQTVYIGVENSQLKQIYNSAFFPCGKLSAIYFAGSRAAWNGLNLNLTNVSADKIHCQDDA